MDIIRARLYELNVAHEITNPRSERKSFFDLNVSEASVVSPIHSPLIFNRFRD